ncbi:hypothetical protein AB0L63_30235 [Nocardia sp. NPDC051990]|uniref:alpha/beta fold hydrolase n=1 Tax=Nocardia sp. NPDC051990 TaxID=3155285 RepID=UPI00343F320A
MRTAVRGGFATAGVVGVLAGAHALRRIGTRVFRPAHADEYRDENFDLLDADCSGAVFAEDGVRLATRECGPPGAPRNARALARELPHSELVRLDDAAHMAHIQFPDSVNAALDRGVIEDIPATAEVAGG